MNAAGEPLPSTSVAAVREYQPADATRSAQRATWLGVLGLLTILSLGRLLITAFSYGIPAWFDEELNPLINLITRGQPITQVDARQYGVVVFLVFDLPLRLFGPNQQALAIYAAWVALPCVAAALVLAARRYAADDPARLLVLLLAWTSAVPLLYVIAQHMVDAWQLLFVSASLFLFTGSARQRRFAGLPLAAATLTKLLPGLLLVYLAVRSWRLAAGGVVGIGVLLAIGQVLYGPLMGFGYPLAMLSMGGDTVARWSTHFENNSIRGLIFKIADGFRLQGDTSTYLLDSRLAPALNVLAYAIAAGLVGYLLFAAWCGRHVEFPERHTDSEKRHTGAEKRHAEAEKRHAEMEKRHTGAEKRHAGAEKRHAETETRHTGARERHTGLMRGSHQHEPLVRRSIEFSLALITMLLVSPHTAQDYLVTALPVLGVWLFLWSNGLPRTWNLGQTLLGVASAFLIGVFVPMNLAARALPINWLLTVTGNAHNGLFVDQAGSAIGAYDFFGFPGLGLILAWLLLVRLERQSA